MADASMRVIGKAIAGGWATIIIGIEAGIETIAATTTETDVNRSGEIYRPV
jgi:hypothetical protein